MSFYDFRQCYTLLRTLKTRASKLASHGGKTMKIRLTARGRALIGKNDNSNKTIHLIRKPMYQEFTLITLGNNGKVLSRKKVHIDLTRYFKSA